MLVFKHFLRDIYEVKFINNRFGKGVIINMKKKKLSARSLQTI